MSPAALVLAVAAALAPGGGTYLPVAAWTGTLQLPLPAERRPDGGVWLVVENAPDPALVGRRVWLRPGDDPRLQLRARRTTVDVRFSDATRANARMGDVHPSRLDGWRAVSPLESLAGGRADDDVQVLLRAAAAVGDDVIEVQREPVEITGRERALVRFLRPAGDHRMKVQHFRRDTGTFDGAEEVVRVTAARVHTRTPAPMTSIDGVETTAQNVDGFYVDGHHDGDTFVVEALEPRALLRLQADIRTTGPADGVAYLRDVNWARLEQKQQTSWSARLDASPTTTWRVGDRALVVHTFGGVGGPRGEGTAVPFTVAGHFSFGHATVVTDPFTGEPRFDVVYEQVYAHGHHGILSTSVTWASYLGSLERGWMFQRPVSDLVVKLPLLTEPYELAGGTFDALDAFQGELAVMMARYRTGDGSGGSFVTPSTSCVQDSSQALFVALRRFRAEVVPRSRAAAPLVQERVRRLQVLLDDLEQHLVPTGFLRADWQQSARLSAVIRGDEPTGVDQAVRSSLTALTLLPRSAHDLLGEYAVSRGADVWVLRTNDIGGVIDGIVPQAPQSVLRR